MKRIGIVLALAFVIGEVEASEVNSIAGKLPFQEDGKRVEVLFNEGFKVVGVSLKEKQKLEKHQTPSAAFLYIAEGKVVFRYSNDEAHELGAGEFYRIPKLRDHEVIALSNSRLLLVK